MFASLKKLFGTAQTRLLKKYERFVGQINDEEQKLQSLSDDALQAKTQEFKDRIAQGESVDDLLIEAFAVVKNACRRLCGTQVHVSGYDQKWDMIPYDVQLLGAVAMHFGSISEMQTGEGKTLTAALPLYLNALTGKPVHLVTVNDYLAKRDCEWIGPVFTYLGLNVTALTGDIPITERKEVYSADIVYGTASEFGFDYLRDHSMAMHKDELTQRGHYFAMVDEIDSILIDEARTPLIISGPSAVSRQMYNDLKEGVAFLVRNQRELCNKMATEARKGLDELGFFAESIPNKGGEEWFKQLWLVSKGTPRNKILKRIRENPDLRAKIDSWETFYYSDQNKEEKAQMLSKLFIIVDERGNEYELTDQGIQTWNNFTEQKEDDFTLLDLGAEYAYIDDLDISEEEKVQKKSELREEDAKRKERAHNLRQLFRAHLLMEKDVDYIVQDQKIVIIDENTGRPQPGRRFSDGLHQAIEAKENVKIQGETQTYATITLQNYFRMYDKLAGMTGTAMTEANEFKELYKLEVLEIPTHKKCIRKDFDDEIYMTEREKYHAILKEITQTHNQGRPILVGTESVEASEKLSRILKQNRLPHTVLNAKQNDKEAEIIALAGSKGAITIATNMAGRGTDIKLTEETTQCGGLHVIGTTRHHSRRIDRQLRGRSGRLGDPGSSKFFISFEDSLLRLFASPRMTALLQRFRPPEGEPISAKVLNKSIETAQKRVEQRNYTMRKYTLEYDDVMNKQRQEVYALRADILQSEDTIALAKEILYLCCEKISHAFSEQSPSQFCDNLMHQFPIRFEEKDFSSLSQEEVFSIIQNKVVAAFETKLHTQKEMIQEMRPDIIEEERISHILHEVIRSLMLRRIDALWQEHLLSIDHLRSDVHLRTIGQKDPLIEFKEEAFTLFSLLSTKMKELIAADLFHFEMIHRPKEEEIKKTLQKKMQLHRPSSPQTEESETSTTVDEKPQDPKIGRNDDCPCGSQKKYKKCCGITS
jgi:preprotein translocase subunit SecA